MRRLALLVTVALPAFLGVQAPSAAQTITPVRGDVRALAFAGDALVLARQPAGRGLVLERLLPGAPASTILRTRLSDDDDQVSLAASADALAFAFSADGASDEAGAAAGVMAGPAAGPLREVATCAAGVLVSPVAVNGARIAWREGGCGEPAPSPRGVTPSVIAVGGADPAAPVRRSPLAGQNLLAALALGPGDAGLAGLLLPSFFVLDAEVRPFGPGGIGAPVLAEQGRAVSPVGILGDGTGVFVLSGVEEEQGCDTEIFTIAPGGARRTIPTGGCITTGEYPGVPKTVRTTADRIVMLVAEPPPSTDARAQKVFVVSTRADGSDRRVLARGGYRAPLGLAADRDRTAWWQASCTEGSELVVHDGPAAGTLTVAPCRVEVRTRRARLRDGRIAVRLRCPTGCSGAVYGANVAGSGAFSFRRGTHTLRLPVRLGRRTSRLLRFDLAVRHGPMRRASIRVRR